MTKVVIRVTLTVILILLSAVRVEPKTITTIYVPMIASGHREDSMASNWDLIIPEATTNRMLNQSFEFSTYDQNWADAGTNPPAHADETGSGNAKFGLHSAKVTFAGANSFFAQDMIADKAVLDGQEQTLSAWVKTTGTDVNLTVQADNSTGTASSAAHTGSGEFERLSVTFTPTFDDGGATTFIFVGIVSQTNLVIAYVDAFQLELKSEATTYCDGDQEGCEWDGTAHNSTSQRSAQSRAGGFVRNFKTDYGFNIGRMIGVGAPVQGLLRSEYETQPGGLTNDVKVVSRSFALSGLLYPTTDLTDLNAKRQALFSVLDPDAVPRTARGPQPVILRYTDAAVDKEIAAHYEGGLEANIGASGGGKNERFTLRFLADDPFFYGVGQAATALDSNDTATLRFLAGRLRSTGQWDDLGLTADPTTGGTPEAVLSASDGSVYFGGTYTGFDANAGWDYLVRYTPSTGAFSRIDGASEFNGAVTALAEAPDGTIFIGGSFTNAGDANGDYLAQYNPTTNTVSSVAAGGTGPVFSIAFDKNGLLYFAGSFAAWNGVNESANIATWNGTAYAAVGNGFNSLVSGIVVTPSNLVYAVGAYTTDWDGSNPFVRFASWDGTVWTQAGPGLNNLGANVTVSSSGIVTPVGAYTDAGSITAADGVSQWNGTAFTAMGSGADGTVADVATAPNDDIYAGGAAATFGGIATEIGRWNGSSWTNIDILLPDQVGPPLEGVLTALDFGRPDPVISDNFDLYIGFNTSATGTFAGATTVTNSGTAPAYPQFVVSRSGGTAASIISLRNETTGREISFDYDLLDGETLTVDLHPDRKTAISSMFKSRPGAVISGSDWGTWVLLKGAQNVTCLVTNTGATITASLIWRDTFKASD